MRAVDGRLVGTSGLDDFPGIVQGVSECVMAMAWQDLMKHVRDQSRKVKNIRARSARSHWYRQLSDLRAHPDPTTVRRSSRETTSRTDQLITPPHDLAYQAFNPTRLLSSEIIQTSEILFTPSRRARGTLYRPRRGRGGGRGRGLCPLPRIVRQGSLRSASFGSGGTVTCGSGGSLGFRVRVTLIVDIDQLDLVLLLLPIVIPNSIPLDRDRLFLLFPLSSASRKQSQLELVLAFPASRQS